MNRILTVTDLSSCLNVHPNTVYKLVEKGEIPFIKRKGVGIRFNQRDIGEWLDQGSSKIHSLLESFSKVELALDQYDKLFLKGGKNRMGQKVWSYPFGSVYLRLTKTGKESWYIYFRFEGKRVREVVKNAQSRADALKVLQVKTADAFRGKYGFKREVRRVSFCDFADQYLEDYAKANKAVKSWKTDEYYLKGMKEFFKDHYLDDITPLEIEKYKAKRLKQGVRPTTVNRCLAVIRKMLNLAVEWGYLQEHSKIKIKFFSEKDNFQEKILRADEERRLFGESSGFLRPILLFAIHTGMRLGEILTLQWSHIDFRKRIIRLEKTKSGRIRFIPVNDSLLDELLKLRSCNGESPYLFLNPKTKKPLTTVKKAFKSACKRADIKGLRFHDLRHTFATRLVERGVDLITVKELLGHHSVVITQRYTHSNSERKKKAVEVLDQDKAKAFVPVVSTPKEDGFSTGLFSAN